MCRRMQLSRQLERAAGVWERLRQDVRGFPIFSSSSIQAQDLKVAW
jgi:hypothetical protein